MDRCRCNDYAEAVKKLKFFTLGTHRPDIIDNYNRGRYYTVWVRHKIDHEDRRFLVPKAMKKLNYEELPENVMTQRSRQIEHMWCSYMSPVKK